MIRVLHTIDTTGPGGAETVFMSLAKGMDPARFRTFAAITGPGWVRDELQRCGIEPMFVRTRGKFSFRYLFDLVRIIRNNGIDSIQSHLLGSNVYSCLAGMICRVPVVSTFHGFVDADGTDRLMAFKRRIINLGSGKIVFVSDSLRKRFVRLYKFSPEKAVTVHNGVDPSVFRPRKEDGIRKELGLGTAQLLVGAVGNIRPAKGYDLFLEAARLVLDRHPECRFTVAGEGTGPLYESLLESRRRLNLEHAFTFLGFRSNAAEVLNNLDVFVLPSVSEGFSISAVEAMACSLPVVATRSGGPEEIIRDGVNGIAVECSAEGIAHGIIDLIENPEARKRMSANARKDALERFSMGKMIEAYHDLHGK